MAKAASPPQTSLRRRWTLAIMTIALCGGLGEIALSWEIGGYAGLLNAKSWLTATAIRNHSYLYDEVWHSMFIDSRYLAKIPAMLEAARGHDAEGIARVVREAPFDGPMSWAMVDADGSTWATNVPGCAMTSLTRRPEIDRPRFVICDGMPMLALVSPVGTSWLVTGLRLGQGYLDELRRISNTEVAMWSARGVVASTARTSDGGTSMPGFDEALLGRLRRGESTFDTFALTVPRYDGFHVLADDTPTLRGVERFDAFVYLMPIDADSEIPFTLVVWVPTRAMTVFALYQMAMMLVGTAVLLVGLYVGVRWLVARLTRPLTELVAATARVASGDLTIVIEPHGEAEVEALASAFNAMTKGLREAQAKLLQSEKMSAVGQLAAGVAHEINNPLGVILGFAHGMERIVDERDPSLRLPVSSIVREANRCKTLVKEMLTFSRVHKPVMQPTDLAALARETLPLVTARARTQDVEILEHIDDVPSITANRTQLQQVLINLCTNALDAMRHGGALTIAVHADGDAIALDVSDSGSGIPAEIRERIFDPFFTTKPVGQGTGLGLSLVYEIVKQHGGSIDVDSEVDRGTALRLRFPTA